MSANQRIIGFFNGDRPDSEGRYLHEIQQWPDHRLESVHDFIQWLFPLADSSPVNPDAPVLDAETIAEIRARPELQQSVRTSWLRMLEFYGLQLNDGRVERAPDFEIKARNWLHPGNHNHLRITRILKCLRLVGLEREAKMFFDSLAQIYAEQQDASQSRITATTFRFWNEAVS